MEVASAARGRYADRTISREGAMHAFVLVAAMLVIRQDRPEVSFEEKRLATLPKGIELLCNLQFSPDGKAVACAAKKAF